MFVSVVAVALALMTLVTVRALGVSVVGFHIPHRAGFARRRGAGVTPLRSRKVFGLLDAIDDVPDVEAFVVGWSMVLAFAARRF